MQLGQRATVHGPGLTSPAARASARARQVSNLTGGARGSVAQRRGERRVDDRRGPPVIFNPTATATASSPATTPATATATEGRVRFSVEWRMRWWYRGTAGSSGSPATRCDGGSSSEVGGRGCFRLQTEGEREGKWSGVCCGSKTGGGRSRGGLYLEIAGGPTRRSSGRSRALGRSGADLRVQEGLVRCGGAGDGVGRARGGLK